MSQSDFNKPNHPLPGENSDTGKDGIQEAMDGISKESATTRNLTEILAISVLIMFVLMGALYLGLNSGNFDSMVFTAKAPKVEIVSTDTGPKVLSGEEIYATYCAACHQGDGTGMAGTFPPLAESQWVTGSKDRVINILLNGMVGPVEVNGTVYNGNMPAWGAQLDDQSVAAVTTYIRSAWGNEADAVSEEEVSAVRDANADQSKPWTAEQLLELYP